MPRENIGNSITPEAWTQLYTQAEKLRLMKPWEKLHDSDLFGIEDAQSGQIVWFAILGALREVFSLTVYVGEAGLGNYLKIAFSEWGASPPHQIVLNVNCMVVEFVLKKELTKEDRETIDLAGFTPPARGRVPQFRSTHLGYGPWHLDSEEAALLARVLPDAVKVVGRMIDNPDLIGDSKKAERLPFFTREPSAEFKLNWRDIPDEVEIEPESSFPFSEFEAAKLRESAKPSEAEWHIGFAMMGGMIEGEDGRPFPAGAFICMDVTSDRVFSPIMYQPDIPQGTLAAQTLLGAIRESGCIPASILSEEADWLNGMLSLAESLGIELFQGRSPVLEKLGSLMTQAMGHGQIP